MIFGKRLNYMTGATVAIGLTLLSGLAFAAEQRSAEDIIMALKPRVTRGLTTSPASAEICERDTVNRCIAQSTHPVAFDGGAREDCGYYQLKT